MIYEAVKEGAGAVRGKNPRRSWETKKAGQRVINYSDVDFESF